MRIKKVMAIENLEEEEANFILFPVSGYKNFRTLIKNYGENPPARKEIIFPNAKKTGWTNPPGSNKNFFAKVICCCSD